MKVSKAKFSLAILASLVLGAAFGVSFMCYTDYANAAEEKQIESALTNCPKCQGAMERGILLDYFALNGVSQALWAPHVPSGLNPFARLPRTKVFAYRCTQCGYLETYAKEK